jgi:hypothetical protein
MVDGSAAPRLLVLCCFVSVNACHSRGLPALDDTDCEPYAQVAPEGTTPRLPSAAPTVLTGSAAVVGYVADSATGRALRGAVVRLASGGRTARDTVFTQSDSVGSFSISGLRPGAYTMSVLSVNFHPLRETLDVREGLDTLRVSLGRGPPICHVRLTWNAHVRWIAFRLL